MNSLIIDFMRICVMHPEIPMSWGMSDVEIAEKLRFRVNGSKRSAVVEIGMADVMLEIRVGTTEARFREPIDAFRWIDSIVE